MTVQLSITKADASRDQAALDVAAAYNFGYAGRTREAAQAHVDELRELGLPAPERVPAIFPLPPGRVTTADAVQVSGDASYGEVEFALVRSERGWLVAAASDHSDFTIEKVSTAHAKTIYPDVLSREAWLLDEVAERWDDITMTSERFDGTGWAVVQSGTAGELLAPAQLIEELAARSGSEPAVGTVILSGTIGGDVVPGGAAWRNTLSDPATGRSLVVEYRVEGRPLEI